MIKVVAKDSCVALVKFVMAILLLLGLILPSSDEIGMNEGVVYG
jgi:hypothetical protein